MLISATSVRAAVSGINDAGTIILPLILYHCKIPSELLDFPTPFSRIHVVCVCASRRRAVKMLGITVYPHYCSKTLLKPGQLSSLPAASLHLTLYLPLSPLHCLPPKCVCADKPIFLHPQTGDVIRVNLICLECSGYGRKLFCSNICKCIHHGSLSLQADDFVIFMKV